MSASCRVKLEPGVAPTITGGSEVLVRTCNARKTLSRPLEATFPWNAVPGSTDCIKAALSSSGVASGLKANNNAAAPATCGQAAEVPLKSVLYWELVVVVTISTPGAAKSTEERPKFEKSAKRSD